jgi:hypothetical protein
MDPGPISFTLLYRFTLLALFTFTCILLAFYHSIRSILCLQQTGEIDNLIVSWEQSTCLCCVQVSRCCWVKTHQQYFWRHCPECHEASKYHLLKFGSFSYWFDKPWFHNWGKTCCCAHHTFYWGSQLVGHLHQYRTINKFYGAVAGEEEDFCKGSLSRTIFYFVFVLLYFIFACIFLSKIQKIASFIVVTLLLLVRYGVP